MTLNLHRNAGEPFASSSFPLLRLLSHISISPLHPFAHNEISRRQQPWSMKRLSSCPRKRHSPRMTALARPTGNTPSPAVLGTWAMSNSTSPWIARSRSCPLCVHYVVKFSAQLPRSGVQQSGARHRRRHGSPSVFVTERVSLTGFDAQIIPMSIGIFLVALDGTIVLSTYAAIGSELNQLQNTSWIATGYMLTLTSFQSVSTPVDPPLCAPFTHASHPHTHTGRCTGN